MTAFRPSRLHLERNDLKTLGFFDNYALVYILGFYAFQSVFFATIYIISKSYIVAILSLVLVRETK